MMQGAVEESKSAVRRAMLACRSSLSFTQCHSLSQRIQARALEFARYLTADAVALYGAIENEVGTEAILAHALANRKAVFYPRMGAEDGAGFFQIFSAAELRASRLGIPEPAPINAPPLTAQGDFQSLIVFVPGVAFDRRGHRLGRGGGWYDRWLAALKDQGVFIGLAFDFQVVERLAAQAWDQKVHYVITEKGIIDCGGLSPSRNGF